jgi:hypothetical protein
MVSVATPWAHMLSATAVVATLWLPTTIAVCRADDGPIGSQPATGPAVDPRVAAVLAADDARIAAMTAADPTALGPLLSDDLRYSHSNGSVDTKASLLELIGGRATRYVAYHPMDRGFSFPSPEIALEHGRAELVLEKDGQPLEATFLFLAVWRLEDGQWRFLQWQSARPPAVIPPGRLELLGKDAGTQGWQQLGEDDFVNVNGEPDTWTWQGDQVHCTGHPVGVIRSREPITNVEVSLEWRHLSDAGNSGVFLWAPPEALSDLPPGKLPRGGIEVQVLDHGYTARYEKQTGKKASWFTTDGDVFPVGTSAMNPFPPVAPGSRRSFPTARHSRGTPEWNHYYIRGVNGEIRLWVNGHEVSGGSGCAPAAGFLCLESEGAPVEFRKIFLRRLP